MRTMSRQRKSGFTLIELMSVIVIIGIVAALAVPGIITMSHRTTLKEMVNTVQEAGVQTRSYAMMTRRAAVLEVRTETQQIWINLLATSDCSGAIRQRCITNVGGIEDLEDRYVNLAEERYVTAEAVTCAGAKRVLDDSGSACDSANLGAAFGLCYTGRGELYVRDSGDDGTLCGDSGDPNNDPTVWERACSDANGLSGVTLPVDRRAGAICGGASLGEIPYLVMFPSQGTPYSKVNP